MKYLELFEGFTPSFKRIDGLEFSKLRSKESDEFSTNDISQIMSSIDGYLCNNKKLGPNKESKNLIQLRKLNNNNMLCRFEISKYKDEWFVVIDLYPDGGGRGHHFYKCDQIDGVVDCLRQIIFLET